MPEPLWLAIRQLLGRIGQLDQTVALQMSTRLAGDLAARTGHPVAQGLHPAAYLGAVLTERQRREWTRAQAQWQRTAAPAPAPAAQPTPAPQPAAPSFEKPAPPTAEQPSPTPAPAPAPGTGFAPPA